MKKMLSQVFCIAIIFFNCVVLNAQTNDWIRVGSDNGEFSIEVPAKHNFFYDTAGFTTATGRDVFKLENMNMLNAFDDGALLSFESYESKKQAINALYEIDKRSPENVKISFSEIKRNGQTIKQIIAETDKFYCLRQYFNSDSRIYVLTAASENKSHPAMRKFLDSLVFKPETKETPDANSILFSSLTTSPIKISQSTTVSSSTTVSPSEIIAYGSLDYPLVVKKPIPVFTNSARVKGIQGTIQLRAVFSEDGFIPQIEITKSLSDGLLRQAVFALLRLKFLPQLKDGKFESATKVIEYKFTIY